MAAYKGTVYFKEAATGRTLSYNVSGDDTAANFITWDELGATQTVLPVPVVSGGFYIWDIQLSSAGAGITKLKAVIDGDQKRANWRTAQLSNFTTDRMTRVGGDYPVIPGGSAFQLLQLA